MARHRGRFALGTGGRFGLGTGGRLGSAQRAVGSAQRTSRLGTGGRIGSAQRTVGSAQRTSPLGAEDISARRTGRLARHRGRLGSEHVWCDATPVLVGAEPNRPREPSQAVLWLRPRPRLRPQLRRGRGFRKNTEPKNGTKNGATFPVKIALFSLLGTIFWGPELVPLLGAIFGPEMVPDSVSRSLLFWVQVLAPRWKT